MPDPQPLTVVHTEASNGWGGQEIRVLSDCRWLRDRGHRVVIVNPREGGLFQRAAEEGFEVKPLTLTKRSQWPDAARLFGWFRELRPDVVATHSSVDSWAGLTAATVARVPCRLRYRHISAPIRPHLLNRFQYRRLCHHILTTGACIRDPIVDRLRISPERIDVIPTGLRFPAELPDREAARMALARELGLDANTRFLGSVAVLRSWKGHRHVIDAFRILADRFPRLHCVFAGEGPVRSKIEQHVAAGGLADRIHLLGHRSGVWPTFRALDVAVLASVKNEGIPQSGLQAFFAETPFVGTRVGGIPEIVTHETTGLLVPPESPNALAEAIQRLLDDSDLASSLTRNARAEAESKFSIDLMGRRTMDRIQAILRRNRPEDTR